MSQMKPGEKALRILLTIHTRWSRDLGASRVPIELGRALQALGHSVEKYSWEDAFAGAGPRGGGRLGVLVRMALSNRSFGRRCARWVRARAGEFDVIDANQSDLPVVKCDLGFRGLLVARSVGLVERYDEFYRQAAAKWPQPWNMQTAIHRILTSPGRRRFLRDAKRSLAAADVVNVSSSDDREYLIAGGFSGERVLHFPLGIDRARREALREAALPAADRLAGKTVAFIGSWDPRKGTRDWPEIFRRIRLRVPAARLLLLGVSVRAETVLPRFAGPDREAVQVVESFASAELPRLLAGATVGVFPGYLEGFGIGVLEKLAAGLPTVAYDAPGPRDILRGVPSGTLVPAGDVDAIAGAATEWLTCTRERFEAVSDLASRSTERFEWDRIASATAEAYSERLAALGGPQ